MQCSKVIQRNWSAGPEARKSTNSQCLPSIASVARLLAHRNIFLSFVLVCVDVLEVLCFFISPRVARQQEPSSDGLSTDGESLALVPVFEAVRYIRALGLLLFVFFFGGSSSGPRVSYLDWCCCIAGEASRNYRGSAD